MLSRPDPHHGVILCYERSFGVVRFPNRGGAREKCLGTGQDGGGAGQQQKCAGLGGVKQSLNGYFGASPCARILGPQSTPSSQMGNLSM